MAIFAPEMEYMAISLPVAVVAINSPLFERVCNVFADSMATPEGMPSDSINSMAFNSFFHASSYKALVPAGIYTLISPVLVIFGEFNVPDSISGGVVASIDML